MADIFVSYTGSDGDWAFWIGHELDSLGHTPHLHDWEVAGGGDIVAWMESRHDAADHVLCVISEAYLKAAFSIWERQAAQWAAVSGRANFIKPVFVEPCRAPTLLASLKRCDLHGVEEPEAKKRLKNFLEPARKPPRGPFPGGELRVNAAVPAFPISERREKALEAGPFAGVPPRIAVFTGRSGELEAISDAFRNAKAALLTQAGKSVGRAAVQGMGGVGKTSLAIEYAYRHRDQYAGVWWCPAETRTGLLTSLAALAVTLGASTAENNNLERAARTALDLLAQQSTPWLLVYDNVPVPADISDLLPAASAHLIITSRFSDWIAWAIEVPVDILPIEEAISFLNYRTGRSDRAGARLLAEALGELPLALDHAAATCRRSQVSFEEYAANAATLVGREPSNTPYPRSVVATFEIAIADAVAKCPEAEALMAYLSQCAPERIPILLIDGAVENADLRMKAIAALAEVSLIKHDPFEDGQPAITVHRLVQAVARGRSEASSSAQPTIHRLIVRLHEIYPTDGYLNSTSWPLCGRLAPHVLFQYASGSPTTLELPDCPALLNRVASYFHGRGSLREAVPLFVTALEIRKRMLGRLHPLTANSYSNLGTLLTDLGDLAEARLNTEQALAIREQVLPPGDPATSVTLTGLAVITQNQGDLVAARGLFERVLADREKALGPRHPDTARALRNLALVLLQLNESVAARPLILRAVSIWEENHGTAGIYTAMGYEALGLLNRKEGKLSEARLLLERAIANWEKDGRREHYVTNDMRVALASLLLESGLPAEALVQGQVALSISERNFGSERTKKAAAAVISSLVVLGRTNEAEVLRSRYSA